MYSVTTGGGQNSSKNTIAERYLALADEYEKTALRERLDYWGNRYDASTEAQGEDGSVTVDLYTPSR
jgi:hypothetical protein